MKSAVIVFPGANCDRDVKVALAAGGGTDAARHAIEPTVLVDPDPDSAVMADEIFGPILPVLTVGSLDEAMRFVNARPKPLGLYLFTPSKAAQEKVLAGTSCLHSISSLEKALAAIMSAARAGNVRSRRDTFVRVSTNSGCSSRDIR
mgnify:CR=1 FL=1